MMGMACVLHLITQSSQAGPACETCRLTPVSCHCLTCWTGRMPKGQVAEDARKKMLGCSLLPLFDRGICDADTCLDGLTCSFKLLWLSYASSLSLGFPCTWVGWFESKPPDIYFASSFCVSDPTAPSAPLSFTQKPLRKAFCRGCGCHLSVALWPKKKRTEKEW